MKKVMVSAIALMLLLAGCSSNDQANNTSKKQTASNSDQVIKKKEDPKVDVTKPAEDPDSTVATKETQQPPTPKTTKKRYKIDPKTWSVVPIADGATKKVVLLTIDDAPDQHAVEMAQTLKDLDVGAIFYLNGHLMQSDEKKADVKKIVDMGFIVGDHTYSHPHLSKLSPADQKQEILSVYKEIKTLTGHAPKFFRAPYGDNTDTSNKIVKEKGMIPMNWSYGYDWNKKYENKKALTDIMLNTPLLYGGAILLMHDRDWTNAALKDIVMGLQKKGYSMVDPHEIVT